MLLRRARLAVLRAQRLQVVGEHAVGAEQALDAHRGGDVGGDEQRRAGRRAPAQHPEHPVGAVDQRQAFLLVQRDRLEHLAGFAERAVGVAHRPLPHQRQRAVRERREVAGAAERAVLVDDRRDARVQHRRVGLRRLDAHAGPAGRERREPQQHQRADDLALDLGSAARRVAADQAALELHAPLRRDVQRGQRAEAGRDAVVRVRVGGERFDDRRGCARSRRAPRRASSTRAPWRATATTSSRVGAPTPIVTARRA